MFSAYSFCQYIYKFEFVEFFAKLQRTTTAPSQRVTPHCVGRCRKATEGTGSRQELAFCEAK